MKNEYSKTIDLCIQSLKERLGNKLEMIYVIGSSATKDVIINWSDIDLIIVIEKYNIEDIKFIKKIVNSYKIKIGTTIYSKKEFERKNIDAKTYYYLYLYENGILDIRYLNKNLKIPKITFEECSQVTKMILFNDLHNLKRMLIYKKLKKDQIKTLYKKIYVVMKSVLIINGEFPKNYKETFNMFSSKFDYEYFDYLKFIDDFINDNISEETIKIYAYNLIVYVSNMIFN